MPRKGEAQPVVVGVVRQHSGLEQKVQLTYQTTKFTREEQATGLSLQRDVVSEVQVLDNHFVFIV